MHGEIVLFVILPIIHTILNVSRRMNQRLEKDGNGMPCVVNKCLRRQGNATLGTTRYKAQAGVYSYSQLNVS